MSAFSKSVRVASLTGLFLGAGVLLAGAASAHVTLSPEEAHAGEYTVATVSVPHGCDGSATTRVAIKIPEELNAVTPTINPGWTVEKKMATLATPVEDAHGNKITERVDQVVYTAETPLPDGYRDTFELSFQVPDAAGKTIYFPSIQTCEKGQTDWVEIAVEGGDEPEHPAPGLKVLAGTGDDGHGAADEGQDGAATASGAATGTDTKDDEAEDSNALGIIALIAGVLGLGLGGTALARTRRKA